MMKELKNQPMNSLDANNAAKTKASIRFKLPYNKVAVIMSVVFFLGSVAVRQFTVENSIVQAVFCFIADAGAVFSVSVVMASVTWLSDISFIFSETIRNTKEEIIGGIKEIKDDMDFTTDLSKFPFDKLRDEKLLELTKMTIHESLKRRNGQESSIQTRLINELEIYYRGIIDEIYRGVVYNYYTRNIEIEPDANGCLTINMRLCQALELSNDCKGIKFSHYPVFPTEEYARSLKYKTIQINGNEMLYDDSFTADLDAIDEFGQNTKQYKRGWEYELTPNKAHTLYMEHSSFCHDKVYFHSAVLTYPCFNFDIICKVVGPYKNEWSVNADAFYTQGHRLDRSHAKDVLKTPLPNGENGFRLRQNSNTPCLLDGTAYKIVVYRIC